MTVKAGDTCLVDVPSWDFQWQQSYFFTTPLPLSLGTQLESHGLVIRRGGRVVFKAADHRVRVEDVRAALRRELGSAATPG